MKDRIIVRPLTSQANKYSFPEENYNQRSQWGLSERAVMQYLRPV